MVLLPIVTFAKTVKKPSLSMKTPTVETRIKQFSEYMETAHGFDKQETYDFLISIKPDKDIAKFFKKQPTKSYTPQELDHFRELAKTRVTDGVTFWKDNAGALARAEKEYGIPAEIIVGLIGIETNFGKYLGKFKEHQVLTTLAFYNGYRTAYFKTQLEHFLVLSKEYNWDKTNIPCSYAGAIGIPQFMPDNLKPFAVDWDNDQQIDLMDSGDAIGSVGNFLSKHGWTPNEPVATKTTKNVKNKTFILRTLPGPGPSYWTKESNFFTIRRYNPLNSYVMSIFILATKVKDLKSQQVDDLDYIQIVVPEEPVEDESLF